VNGFTRKLWSEADRLALMAEFECWDGTRVSFRESRGVSVKSFRCWRRRYGPAARVTTGKPGGFVKVAAVPGWDAGLSLGSGGTARPRRPRSPVSEPRADGPEAGQGRRNRDNCARGSCDWHG
ncbi:MAG: hypothetical protein OXD36_00295, partial [Rhodobacter sp.]|nr:hypothetical protein [Rhodobacter sp.]